MKPVEDEKSFAFHKNRLQYLFNSNKVNMNRKNQSQGSTQRLLKSKYNQKQKIKTSFNAPLPLKKIMLSDLCAQQKLKVGELIKINESRKLQMAQLNEELSMIRSKFAECQIKLNELLPQLAQKQLESQQKTQKLRKRQIYITEKENEIANKSQECKQLRKIVERITKIERENRGMQTQFPNLADYGAQTKKPKKRNQQVQTEIFYIQQDQVEVKNKTNAKSMAKSSRSQSKNQHSKNKYSFSKSQLQQKSAEASENYDEVNRSEQYNQNLASQEVEQCFQDLTRKWMQLKQKNLSKLKNQYEQSKNIFYKQIGQNNVHPQEFTEELTQQFQKENEDLENQIDQHQLNKLLKSKNFSASRLLTSKGIMGESQSNDRKSSYHQSNNKVEVNKGKPSKKPTQNSQEFKVNINPNVQNINPNKGKPKTIQKIQNYQKEPMFTKYYENDLMDLVEELDK